MKDSPVRRVVALADVALFRYWLATGFAVFLTGLFWTSRDHNYKVILNFMLMLPALAACLAVPRWWPALRRVPWLLAALLAYLVYMAVSDWLINGAGGEPSLLWSLYVALFVVAVGGCLDVAPTAFVRMLWASALVAAAAATYAIGHDAVTGLLRQQDYRLIGYGALYNPLRTGHLLGVFLIIAVWSVVTAPLGRTLRWLAGAAALAIFAAILLTDSRAPLVSLLGVGVWMAVGAAPQRQRGYYLATIAAITMLALWLFWAPLMERGLSLRPELWHRSFEAALAHPWFGVGMGGQLTVVASNGVTYYDTHNAFLAALYYGGGVGLALFAILFGTAFWTAWRTRAESPLCALAAPLQMFGIATLQFDGGGLIGRPNEFWLLYWLPIAVTMYAYRQRGRY